MEANVVIITPHVAASILQNNKSNRPLSPSTVKNYADTILRGAWKLNGEAIKISRTGILLDGQHRLHAVVKANVPVNMLLIEDLGENVFDTLDSGRKRTSGDVMAIKGEVCANSLASMVRLCAEMELNDGVPFSMKVCPTDIQLATLEKNPDIRNWVHFSRKLRFICGHQTVISGLLYMFSKKDKRLAEDFGSRLVDGAGLESENPIKILRDRLMIERASKSTSLNRLTVAAFVVKAWNAYRANRQLKVLRWKDNEEFPKII